MPLGNRRNIHQENNQWVSREKWGGMKCKNKEREPSLKVA